MTEKTEEMATDGTRAPGGAKAPAPMPAPQFAMMDPEFERLVQRIIQTVDKPRLEDLRRDFHTRLRITLTQPDNAELIEDLWDFFYDWCVFEKTLPDQITALTPKERDDWNKVKENASRGLFTVAKKSDDGLRLKEIFTGKAYYIPRRSPTDFIGIERADIIEARILGIPQEGKKKKEERGHFARRPSYHPVEVHGYIKQKVRQFKKDKDLETYKTWLWLLVGMYLKHRIYNHMPIDKIYDDNSRI